MKKNPTNPNTHDNETKDETEFLRTISAARVKEVKHISGLITELDDFYDAFLKGVETKTEN